MPRCKACGIEMEPDEAYLDSEAAISCQPCEMGQAREDADRFRWLAGTAHARIHLDQPDAAVVIYTSHINLPQLREAIDLARSKWPEG